MLEFFRPFSQVPFVLTFLYFFGCCSLHKTFDLNQNGEGTDTQGSDDHGGAGRHLSITQSCLRGGGLYIECKKRLLRELTVHICKR